MVFNRLARLGPKISIWAVPPDFPFRDTRSYTLRTFGLPAELGGWLPLHCSICIVTHRQKFTYIYKYNNVSTKWLVLTCCKICHGSVEKPKTTINPSLLFMMFLNQPFTKLVRILRQIKSPLGLFLVGPRGLEPLTSSTSRKRSSQLS